MNAGYSLKAKPNGNNHDVPLSVEWGFVEYYPALERLRLGERLKVRTDLPPSTVFLLSTTSGFEP